MAKTIDVGPANWLTAVQILAAVLVNGRTLEGQDAARAELMRCAAVADLAVDLLAALQNARGHLCRAGQAMNVPMFAELSEIDDAIAKAAKLDAAPKAVRR